MSGKRKITKSKWSKEDIITAIVKMRTEKMATNKTIIQFLMGELGYGQAYSYDLLREARQEIIKLYNKENEARIEESIAQLENMLEGAYERKDFKLAYNIRQEINKLTGAYSADKLDITSGGDKIQAISFEIIQKKKADNEPEDSGD